MQLSVGGPHSSLSLQKRKVSTRIRFIYSREEKKERKNRETPKRGEHLESFLLAISSSILKTVASTHRRSRKRFEFSPDKKIS